MSEQQANQAPSLWGVICTLSCLAMIAYPAVGMILGMGVNMRIVGVLFLVFIVSMFLSVGSKK
jgi:hypothetical protein